VLVLDQRQGPLEVVQVPDQVLHHPQVLFQAPMAVHTLRPVQDQVPGLVQDQA